MQDELLLNLSGHIVALINVVLDAGCKTGDKDEILERLDTINILIGEIRNAAEKKESPAIPQQAQTAICECKYCKDTGYLSALGESVQANEHSPGWMYCPYCSRKLSAVR